MRIILTCCCLTMLLLQSGCERDIDPHPMNPINEEAVKEDIAALTNGSRPTDPDAEHLYHQAVSNLIKRGSTIEPHILFELKHGSDWAIQLGCIEVLDAIGTRKCIEPIIECLHEAHPMVAQKAMYSLRGLLGHHIVPETDRPGAPVPPIPRRQEREPMEKDYSNWVKWYDENGKALYRAWKQWYQDNKANIKI